MRLIKKINYENFSIRIILLVLLLGLFCLSFGIQSNYLHKGFVFKHPYFENKCLYTSQNTIDVDTPAKFLKLNPECIVYSGNAQSAFGVFISGDSLYIVRSNTEKGFCNFSLIFSEPVYIPINDTRIDSNTAIYGIKNGSEDVFTVCVGSKNGKIYRYSINSLSYSIVSKDSIILKNAQNNVITSINGAFSSYNSVDSVLWITGTNGLLRLVHLKQGSTVNDSIFDIASAGKVNCYGDGFVGTEDGSVYERKGTAFEKVLSVTGAVYSINRNSLAGKGVVYVKNSVGWTKVKEGSTVRYRECRVSANGSGGIYELVDSNWDVDSVTGLNSSTRIVSALPIKIMPYINSQNKYEYTTDFPETLTIKLFDYEENYEPLSIVLKTRIDDIEVGSKNGVVELKNYDPSESCFTGNISFADSVFKIVLTSQRVIVTALALEGRQDLFCMQCALKPYTFKNDQMWALYDELVISSATQTLTIVNKRGAVLTISGTRKREEKRISVVSGTFLASIGIPAGTQIMDVRAYDLSGQMITSDLTGGVIRLGQTGSRVVTLQVRLFGGKVLTLRSVLTRN